MSDIVTARLRTIVPVVWGYLVAWLLIHVTNLPDTVVSWLNDDAIKGLITTGVILAWYWLWNKYKDHVPDWLITVVIGSPKTPNYNPDPVTVGIQSVTPITLVDGDPAVHVALTNGVEEIHDA